jgi:hypothetical protein
MIDERTLEAPLHAGQPACREVLIGHHACPGRRVPRGP